MDPRLLAITIDQTQHEEQRKSAQSTGDQFALTLARIGTRRKPRSSGVTQGNYPDPRQNRVGSTQTQALERLQPAAIMQNRPRHIHCRILAEVQGIQQVMPGNDYQSQRHQRPARQDDKDRQRHHAQANRPDDLQIDRGRRKLEGPGEIHQGELQHNKKQAALEQEPGNPGLVMPLAIQKRRQAGEENEQRRAEMRQGSTQKQVRRRVGHIHRVGNLKVQQEGFPHVIEQHEQDNQATQCIDRLQARGHQRLRDRGRHGALRVRGFIAAPAGGYQ